MARVTPLLARLFRRASAKPSTAPGERLYAIGDVHGRMDLFQNLLQRLEKDVEARSRCSTRLILLGDIIDRGRYSRQLLDLIQRIQSRSDRVVLLCGNHEEMLLASADGDEEAQLTWVEYGGDATLKSYGINLALFMDALPATRAQMVNDAVGETTLAWLRSLPAHYSSGGYFFCHAGIRPGVPLALQKRKDLLWIRRDFLRSRRAHGAMIVHGHSETDEVELLANRINVDTAAYRSGVLTAVGLQGTGRWIISTEKPVLSRAELELGLARTGNDRRLQAR